ncbi:hypothetical protein ERX35_007925 [Macrococcus equipercicus]|uniref:Uncharacterized protein n=1 Tax=Macrococcus equipercicus TaxID=69967 RepID=A0ABQ6R7S0_9STAP|nr:hypothetical protein [Macrococcus equipercicus]KAA1039133.1 hypothetical protein ERX35_007925 [Macrococcus equipercicus]
MDYIAILLMLITIVCWMIYERYKTKRLIKKVKEEDEKYRREMATSEKQLTIVPEVEEVKPLPVFHQYHDLSEKPHKTYHQCSVCESYNITRYNTFVYSFQDINSPILYCQDCGTKGTNRKHNQGEIE